MGSFYDGNLQQEARYAIERWGWVVHRGPLTMAISNRKQDMPFEDRDEVVNWGPFTMAIFNRKQDMPLEDGVGVVN